jgi:hypothetical protein
MNAGLLSTILHTIAEKIEETAPGHPHSVSAGWQYTLKPGQEVSFDMGEISVSNEDAGTLSATVSFTDAGGHPTTADDVPSWSSSDESVASVAASEDGLSADVTITGTPGSAIVSVHSVNDDGSEVDAAGTVHVMAGDATMGSVEFTQSAEAPTESV